MEKIAALLERLQEQMANGANRQQMMVTAQMLLNELATETAATASVTTTASKVAVVMPNMPSTIATEIPAAPTVVVAKQEKIVEVLQVDEAEIEAELNQLKEKSSTLQQLSVSSKPKISFEDIVEELPTFVQHQLNGKATTPEPMAKKEINEAVSNGHAVQTSLNDLLKENKKELGESIQAEHIKDLRKAFSINDRHLFINDLFRGDEAMFDRSIKTINGFHNGGEAEFWMQRELFTKIGWNDKDDIVKQFVAIIRRRF
jgi:hypothetical protein